MRVIDTGGYDDRGSLHTHVQHQASSALKEADVVVLMLDGKEGVTASDVRISSWLRKELGRIERDFPSPVRREILVVANKTEGAHLSDRVMDALSESSRLGFGEPIFMSASHGEGMSELNVKFARCAEERGMDVTEDTSIDSLQLSAHHLQPIQVAIMGRPNVGKSALLNSILKEKRVISGG